MGSSGISRLTASLRRPTRSTSAAMPWFLCFRPQVPSVRTSYPCFFSEIDYDRYSEDHNAILDDLCTRIEAAGAEIVMAHHSSLPALAARTSPLTLSAAPQLDGGRAA